MFIGGHLENRDERAYLEAYILLGIITILFTNLLLQLFEDFSFGEYHLDTIHLSTRGSFDAEGHYECAASVPLP